jgi:drug/metabolite transporter (DMT)-like permease
MFWVYLWLTIQTLIASFTHIIAKAVVQEIPSVSLTLLRVGVASFGFGVIMLFSKYRNRRVDRKDRLKIFILGLLAVPLNQFLFLLGIKFTTPANASLTYALTPIFALILAWFILGESMGMLKISGVILSFIGIAVVFAEQGISLSIEYLKGNLIIMFGALCWALYSILGKPMVARYGAFYVTGIATIIGTFVYLPIGISEFISIDISSISLASYLGVLYLGIVTSIFGYFIWYYAIGRIEASKVTIFTNGQPVMTTILGVIIFGNPVTPFFVIGGLMVITGVILTQIG